jgi:hypothetical protein
MALIVWVHNLVYRAIWGLGRWILTAIWRWMLVVYALLHEEVRRYLGLALSGTLIVLFGKATLNYAPPPAKRWLVLVCLVMLAVWAMAVRRGIRYTRHNNLMRVRQRAAIQNMAADVASTRRQVTEGLARRTQGSRTGRLFKANRDADAAEAARAEAEQQAADAAAAEQSARDAYLESLPPDHDPFESMEGAR